MSIPIVCGKWLCTCCEKTICSVGGCPPPSLHSVMNSPNKTHFNDNISTEKVIMDNQLLEWWLFTVRLEKLNLFTSLFSFISLLRLRVNLFNVKQNIFGSSHSYWWFISLKWQSVLYYIHVILCVSENMSVSLCLCIHFHLSSLFLLLNRIFICLKKAKYKTGQ